MWTMSFGLLIIMGKILYSLVLSRKDANLAVREFKACDAWLAK